MRSLPLFLLLAASTARAQVRNDTFLVFTIHTPPAIARVDTIYAAAFGRPVPDGGHTARLVLGRDASGSDLGCNALTNAAEVAGQVALFRRGTCEFGVKGQTAQDAGAVAFLVFNHNENPQETDSTFVVMGPPVTESPEITGGFLARYIRNAILPTVQSGAVITVTLAPVFVAVATEPESAGQGFALRTQPNPSRGPVAVALTLSSAGVARVVAYDVLGREVSVVHDGPLASGAHRLVWEAAGLPPGVYVLRATSGAASASQTVTLAR